jgi:hypothetical protein
MKREQIENTLQSLAMSQGLYGRLLNQIYSLPEEEQEQVWQNLEEQNFKEPLDLVLYIEG